MSQPQVRHRAGPGGTVDLRDDLAGLQARLAASEAAFVGIVERSSDGILVVDDAGGVRFANAAACAMLGRSATELVGAELGFPVLPGDVTEVELLRTGGQVVYAEMRVVDTEWEGQPCLLALLRDVTDRHRAEAELAQRATHDHLTGLPNRYLLEDRLAKALDRLSRHPGSVALFVADLDDFKSVNDRLGHAAGDAVLVEAARRIQSVLRPEDSVARFGGDEFVLLCAAMGQTAATELATRLVAAFREPIAVAGTSCRLGVSVGFALADRPGATAEELVAAADEQMYRHKRRSRSLSGPAPARGEEPPARAGRPPSGTEDYRFTLYVAGAGERSDLALQDVERLCETHLPPGAYVVTPVDVLESPEQATAAHVLVTPTLVRNLPLPALRVVGDLSGASRIAEALDLPRSHHG